MAAAMEERLSLTEEQGARVEAALDCLLAAQQQQHESEAPHPQEQLLLQLAGAPGAASPRLDPMLPIPPPPPLSPE